MNEKVKADTIARTICLIVTLLNQILAIAGKEAIPITENQVYQNVSLLATIGISLWNWWKNNSFTPAAIKADKLMKKLKAENKNV